MEHSPVHFFASHVNGDYLTWAAIFVGLLFTAYAAVKIVAGLSRVLFFGALLLICTAILFGFYPAEMQGLTGWSGERLHNLIERLISIFNEVGV